jgi:hypothetical protein
MMKPTDPRKSNHFARVDGTRNRRVGSKRHVRPIAIVIGDVLPDHEGSSSKRGLRGKDGRAKAAYRASMGTSAHPSSLAVRATTVRIT